MKKFVLAIALCYNLFSLSYAQGIKAPSEGKAVVYFVRVSGLGFAINFGYFDKDKFIGKFNGSNYMRYECEPGEHLFWARSENKDFITAELEAGKIYFVEASPQMGFIKAGVQLNPVNPKVDTKRLDKIEKLINKKPAETFSSRSSVYVYLKRVWKTGDTVTLALPKSLHLEPTPDNPRVTAIMWGPLALAGDMGPRLADVPESARTTPRTPVPMLVSASRRVTDFVEPTGAPGTFRAKQVARVPGENASAGDVALTPFHRTHRRRYALYFDLVSPEQYDAHVVSVIAAREAAARMEAATVGDVTAGNVELERGANYLSNPSDRPVGRSEGQTNRGGAGWFSYELRVDATAPMALVLTHFVEPGLPAPVGPFSILVDGTEIAQYVPDHASSGFFDARYDIPAGLTQGKGKVTVAFQAGLLGRIVPVFRVRSIRR